MCLPSLRDNPASNNTHPYKNQLTHTRAFLTSFIFVFLIYPVSADSSFKLNLTETEQRWLESHPEVRFTEAACKKLTGVPKAFLGTALKGIIKEAKQAGVSMVDEDFMDELNANR